MKGQSDSFKSSSKRRKKSSEVLKRNKKKRRHRNTISDAKNEWSSSGYVSSSSSDSETDIRGRRRKDSKRMRKRSRSKPDKDLMLSKRRKYSKRQIESVSRKKESKKKRRHREMSVSTASSDSRSSCSICGHSENSSTEERGTKRLRRKEISKPKGKERKGRGLRKKTNKRSRSRSPSYSTGHSSESTSCREEDNRTKKASKHLKSVVIGTGLKRDRDRKDQNFDLNNLEILPDCDYPSCKSNESYDEGKKREYGGGCRTDTICGLHKKRGIDENLILERTHKLGEDDVKEQFDAEVEDLESVLRKKALENFKKFKKSNNFNNKSNSDKKSEVAVQEKLTSEKAESMRSELCEKLTPEEVAVQEKLTSKKAESMRSELCEKPTPKQGLPNEGKITTFSLSSQLGISTGDQIVESSVPQYSSKLAKVIESGNNISGAASMEKFKKTSSCYVNLSSDNELKITTFPPSSELGVSTGDQIVEGSAPLYSSKLMKVIKSGNNSSGSASMEKDRKASSGCVNLGSDNELLCNNNNLKQHSLSKEQIGSLPNQSLSINNVPEIDNLASNSAANGHNLHVSQPDKKGNFLSNASCSNVETSEKDSDKRKTDAKEGSQLQHKTMTVMRGGEMVQVSYKVYIPKKAPALARRKLQR